MAAQFALRYGSTRYPIQKRVGQISHPVRRYNVTWYRPDCVLKQYCNEGKRLLRLRETIHGFLRFTGLVFLALAALFFSPRFSYSQEIVSPAGSLSDTAALMAPQPPTNVIVKDLPNDRGEAVIVRWNLSPDDDGNGDVTGYIVSRSESAVGPFEPVGDAVRGALEFSDNQTDDSKAYYYRVDAFLEYLDAAGEKARLVSVASSVGPIKSTAQWFNLDRKWVLLFLVFVAASIIYFIEKAKKGGKIYVRKIAGIDAVDEAVGRATEMGKKIFFIPGIQDMNDVQTIAGIAILGRVAELAAQYDTWLEVPVCRAMVMVTARESMKEAYAKMGRPDSFREAQVHYLTEDQFGYAAAVGGMVVREKPATIFYMGAFFAESLILSETGNSTGAIQIAGTAQQTQLPFFVSACDYTLLGEELFAASAYLSREPRQLGSLKGQDAGKVLFLLAIIIGGILATFTSFDLSTIFKVE